MPIRKYTWPNDMPLRARDAYRAHSYNAKRRGIPFLFSPDEWWAWWKIDGRWNRRGMGNDALVMARLGDSGPYALDNVYCATHLENKRDVPFERRSIPLLARKQMGLSTGGHHGKRGFAHPKSKAIKTPAGTFGSAALAAEHFGITRQHAARKAKAGADGWGVVEDGA